MEEHLLYKQEVGGLIPSCPDIHMEWKRLFFGDRGSSDHHQWDYDDMFWHSPKYEMVTVNECHQIYA